MPPQTTPTIALQSLLSSVQAKSDALAKTSEDACEMADDNLEGIVRHCIETDAVLCVAEAIILASLNTRPEVQS